MKKTIFILTVILAFQCQFAQLPKFITSDVNSRYIDLDSKMLIENFEKNNHSNTKNNSVCLYDSIQWNRWDTISLTFKRHGLTRQFYVGAIVDSAIYQTWIGNVTGNNYKYIYSYDLNGRLISRTLQFYNNGWTNNYKNIYTYDANNNMINELIQSWNNLSISWVTGGNHSFTYNTNNILISELFQTWNVNNLNWDSTQKITYTNNSNNLVIYQLNEVFNNNTWKNQYDYTNTYDGNNNLLTVIAQYWLGTNWYKIDKHNYTYDAINNVTLDLYESWDGNVFINNAKTTYTYDLNNNLEKMIRLSWKNSTNSWTNESQYFYYYDCATAGISEFSYQSKAFNVYPNPTNSVLYLDLLPEFKHIKILDITGKTQIECSSLHKINVENLNNGIYIIQAFDESERILKTCKFVKN